MALNGSGVYTPPSPEYPAIPNTTILASDFNAIISDLATALSLAIYKDGQASMAANLNMATYKLTNLGDGTNAADAVNFLQVFSDPTFTGTIGTGVVLTGTKATITASVLDVTVPDVNITGSTTLDIVSPALNLTSATAITFTAPTITNVGSLVATLDTTTTAVTQTSTDSSTKLATTAFVQAVAFNSALPTLTGNDGKLLTITAGVVGWGALIDVGVMSFADTTDSTKRASLVLSGITAGQDRLLTVKDENYTLVGATSTDALKLNDYTDATKVAKFQLSSIATATTRVLTLPDNDVTVDTPGWRLLTVVTASNSATVDIEHAFDSTYDKYVIEVDGLTIQNDNTDLYLQLKIGGVYLNTNEYNYHSTRLSVPVTPVSAAAQIIIVTAMGNDTAANGQLRLTLANPSSTAFSKNVHYDGVVTSNSGLAVHFVGGGGTITAASAALTGLRFKMSAGNIVAGSFKLYGLRKAV